MKHLLSRLLVVSFAACSSTTPDESSPDPSDSGSVLDRVLSGADCEATTGAGTEHTGFVSADEVWSAEDSPHRVTGTLYLRSNARLTIEPCAEVRLSPGVSFDMGGTGNASELVARGTLTDDEVLPVRFVADEAGTHWGTLSVFAPGSVDLAVAALIDGASASSFQDDAGALEVRGSDSGVLEPLARVEDVVIQGAEGLGVSLSVYGAFTDDSNDLVVMESGNAANPYPVRIGAPAVGTLPAGAYTGNEVDEILIDTLREVNDADSLPNRGVPYRLPSTLYVRGDAGEAVLEIEAGVTVRFESGAGLIIGDGDTSLGALVAAGTADAPVTFTSAEEAPAAADWRGLYFDGSSANGNQLDHVVIEYAGGESTTVGYGCGPSDNDASVLIRGFRPGGAFLQDSTIRHGGGETAIVLGWTSDLDGPDFVTSNTFTDVPSCNVARWQNETAPECPGGDRGDCL